MIRKVAPLALAGSLALAGCGAGTEAESVRPTRLTEGVNFSQGGLDVRNLFVLGPVPGAPAEVGSDLPLYGTLINNTAKDTDKLVAVTAGGFAQNVVIQSEEIVLPAHTAVALGGPQTSVLLKGIGDKLHGGESVKLTLSFTSAPQISVTVPVVPATGPYATLSPAPAATPTGAPATGGDVSVEATPAGNAKPTRTPRPTKTAETSEH
ncbi:hypothetical protein LO762_13710 [Actinocorallia sp. API 0066]|uniref:hypothetical protein n=1 Tax=Actinocorallia sp. API 0066 TaxID=2896846 RepID=UPI001E617CE9|nr:hypothetical protein [Actinocorallia sp. API 0066]MCD0450240.1 hypothetical protein [Actinocorallia sp. API 0066]